MDDEKLILEGEEKEEQDVIDANEPDAVETEPAVTSTEEQPLIEENGAIETSIKTFTQDDVDKLVGDTRVKTREKTFRYIYDRYGVKNEEELDDLVANAQRYDTQKEMYEADKANWETERNENASKLGEMSETIALMQSGVDKDRYEDVKLILKGKGLEVNLENIEAELETHPEWKPMEKNEEETPVPEPQAPKMDESQDKPKPMVTTRITRLGNEPKPVPQESEEEQAEKLFKMKFHG